MRKMLHSYQYINFGTASIKLVKDEFNSESFNDSKYLQTEEAKIFNFRDKVQIKNVSFFYDNKKNIIFQQIKLLIN